MLICAEKAVLRSGKNPVILRKQGMFAAGWGVAYSVCTFCVQHGHLCLYRRARERRYLRDGRASAGTPHEGLYRQMEGEKMSMEGKYLAARLGVDYLWAWQGDAALFEKDGRIGLVDRTGNVLAPPE